LRQYQVASPPSQQELFSLCDVRRIGFITLP
jgi:hypothetical protein